MADPAALLTFAGLSLALIAVPGPSVLFVLGRAVALGRRGALLTVVGNAAGVYVQVLLVAAGLGAVVARSIAVFTTIKVLGALYLVWLGVQTIRHRRLGGAMAVVESGGHDESVPRTSGRVVREGFVVGVANPKAMVFFAAFLPQFVVAGGASVALQMAVLGLLFVAIALVSDGAWGLVAGTAREWFASEPSRLGRIRAAGGVTMIALGVHVALTGRGD